MPLLSTPMMATPSSAPTMVPLPPCSAQPPRTAAVIASSSRPCDPEIGWPEPVRAASRMPATPAADAAHDVDADPVAVDVDAGEARDDRIAAEGVDVAADDGLGEEDLEEDGRADEHPDRKRQAEHHADPHEAEGLVEDRDRLAVGDDEGDAAEDRHGAEGGDHRVDAAVGDDQAVDQPGDGADGQTGDDAGEGRVGRLDRHGGRDRGQADDRADRDVEPAGDDHHGLAHGEHAEDGDGEPDVEDVPRGEEHVAAQRAEDDEENGERDEEADIVDADAVDDGRPPVSGHGLGLEAVGDVVAADGRHLGDLVEFGPLAGHGEFQDFASSIASPSSIAGDLAAGHDDDAVGEADQLGHFGGDEDDRRCRPPRARRSGDRSRAWRRCRCRASARRG